ncbi:MAG: hypothetical protein SFU25_02940 [Candidatus Caenarcaniphilales bacterium]|nr:hypothetical protein [Candidatus Caenarcaniphilales bacterium]
MSSNNNIANDPNNSEQKPKNRNRQTLIEKIVMTSSLFFVCAFAFLYLVASRGRAVVGNIMEPIIQNKLLEYGYLEEQIKQVKKDDFPSVFSHVWFGQYLDIGFKTLFKNINSVEALEKLRRKIQKEVDDGQNLSHFRKLTLPKLLTLMD